MSFTPAWEKIRERLSHPLGREAWNGRRVRVIRVLVYEGDGALVAACLSQSLPTGRRDLRGYSITVHEDEHEDLGPSESRPRTITQAELDALRLQVSALAQPPVAFDPEGDEEPDGWTGEEVDRALRAVAARDEAIQDLLRRLESVAR